MSKERKLLTPFVHYISLQNTQVYAASLFTSGKEILKVKNKFKVRFERYINNFYNGDT